jgi:hypothetical protein
MAKSRITLGGIASSTKWKPLWPVWAMISSTLSTRFCAVAVS